MAGWRVYCSSEEGGVSFPSFEKVANTFDFKYMVARDAEEAIKQLKEATKGKGIWLVELQVSSNSRVIPQCRAGRPNEDLEPLMDRGKFRDEMIVGIEDRSF